MVKNSSLRYSASSLSLRPKPTIEPHTDPTATPSISSMPPQMPGNKSKPTHPPGIEPARPYFLIPPPPTFDFELFNNPNLDRAVPEEPKLPDVLDDGWFEQRLQKLTDMKLELARTRLESQGQKKENPKVVSVGAAVEAQEDAEAEHECFVKPVEEYTKPFCEFLTENPTVFHAVDYFKRELKANGFTELSERSVWTFELDLGGKYFVERNGSSLIAFVVGENYICGNGVAMIAGHVDALTARLKPVSAKHTTAGYVQLGVAPYAGGLNPTWWDRDLGISGRVLIRDSKTGKIMSKLVKLGWPSK